MIDKKLANDVLSELSVALKTICDKHGLSTPKIKASYGDVLRFTIETTEDTVDSSGVNTSSREALYYTKYGFSYLNTARNAYVKLAAPLGTRFTVRGTEYIFAGIAATRKKYPIYCIADETQKPTLFTEDVAARINEAAGVSA